MFDFIAYNRINTFVNKLVTVSETITDANYIDNSPTGIFTGPKGTILQKRGNVLSYKYPGDQNYTILNYASNSIDGLLTKYSVILNRGVNKNATWIKLDSETGTKWQNQGSVNKANYQSETCEILPSSPCLTPIISYFGTPTQTNPTPTPFVSCPNQICAKTALIERLVVDNRDKCEPGSTTPGTYGEILVCVNYLYVFDGTKWKRVELTTYY